ncbi:MAG: septum formation initiator family protein [Bdellovibrionales bacterium]|nr:septum formation initiator family protein [Bdellovibrionales bacterium]
MVIKKPFIVVRNFLNSPVRVLALSAVFFLINFIANGSFIRLWNLKKEIGKLETSIEKNQKESQRIEENISKSKDPSYIERQAREKLDLVGQDDLVFIFPPEESSEVASQ